MGNRDVSFMEGTLLLFDKSIWCRQTSQVETDEDEVISTVDQSLILKNIITNVLDINNIRNSLI